MLKDMTLKPRPTWKKDLKVTGSAVRIVLLLFAIVIFTFGCGSGEEPAPQVHQVKKPVQAPSRTDSTAAPAEAAQAEEEVEAAVKFDSYLRRIWEEEGKRYVFNATDRPDPFMPVVWDAADRQKRAPTTSGKQLTPLQQVPLSSITLVAVIAPQEGEPLALVEDSTGTGYIVKKGTPIGQNDGQIVGIFPSEVRSTEGLRQVIDPARIEIKESYRYFNTTRTKVEVIRLKGEE